MLGMLFWSEYETLCWVPVGNCDTSFLLYRSLPAVMSALAWDIPGQGPFPCVAGAAVPRAEKDGQVGLASHHAIRAFLASATTIKGRNKMPPQYQDWQPSTERGLLNGRPHNRFWQLRQQSKKEIKCRRSANQSLPM